MEYEGKLYGKIGGKYFDTGKTTDEWDKLQAMAGQVDAIVRCFSRDELRKILKNVCKTQKTTCYVELDLKKAIKDWFTGKHEFPIQKQLLECRDTHNIETTLNFIFGRENT